MTRFASCTRTTPPIGSPWHSDRVHRGNIGARLGLSVVVGATGIGCGPGINPSGGEGTAGSSAAASGSTLGASASAATSSPAASTSTGPALDSSTGGTGRDVPGDSTGPVCYDYATMGCGALTPGPLVEGETPLGPVTLDLAVFASFSGCAGCGIDANINDVVLAARPKVIDAVEPGDGSPPSGTLILEGLGGGGFEGPTGRPVFAMALLALDDSLASAPASVVFDAIPTSAELSEPFDPRTAVVIGGSFEIDDPQWDLAGDFMAVYCPRLNQGLICE